MIRVIAHRGASAEAPENTEAAVRLALEQGADAVECDVQLSRDGVPLLIHDPDLARVGGGAIVIADHDAADLVGRELQVEGRSGTPSELLRLDQWLSLLPAGVLAVVELKEQGDPDRDRSLAAATARWLHDREESAVISFGDLLVTESARQLPYHRVGPIRNRPLDEAGWREMAGLARGCAVLKKTLLSAEALAALSGRGEVWSYALDEEVEIRAAIALGIDGLISNRPAVARRLLDGPPAATG